MKDSDLIRGAVLILSVLSEVEVNGIPGVAVKCIDIRRNIEGEGSSLDLY